MADAHGHLSPADVDAELHAVVRQHVEHGAYLQFADAEDAHRAHHHVGEEAIVLEREGRLEPHALKFVGNSGKRIDARGSSPNGDAWGDPGRRDGDGAGRQ